MANVFTSDSRSIWPIVIAVLGLLGFLVAFLVSLAV
jgi:hypothetical protein